MNNNKNCVSIQIRRKDSSEASKINSNDQI